LTIVPSCKKKNKDATSQESTAKTVEPATKTDTVESEAPSIVMVPLPTDPDAIIPLDSKIQQGVLENGVTYYIRPNGVPENRAEFWISINAGSFQEDDDQRGLAHFLEHMAFNGTKSFPKNELVAKLESLGVKFGAHLNASTSFDETIYKLLLPTDKPENVDLGMQILSEWASAITLDPSEFEKERGVVLAEKRSRDGAQMRLMQSIISDVFAGTRYANRLPIGTPEVLKGAPVSAIERFYKDWYQPNNVAVYVVGDIDPKQIEGMIKEKFGAIPANANPRKPEPRKQPAHDGFKFLTVQDKELPVTAVAIGRLTKVAPKKSLNDIRAQYVDIMAMLMLTKRLEEAQKRGHARYLMAGGSPVPLLRETEAEAFFAMVDPSEVEGGLQDLLNEMERARRFGFTESEFSRANKNLLSMLETSAKEDAANKEQSSDLVEELTRYHLGGDNMTGRPMEFAMFKHFSETVELAEISPVLNAFMKPEGLIAMSVGSAAKDALDEGKVLAMIAALPTTQLVAYADKPSDTKLIAQAPTAGTITKETYHKDSDVYEWTLSNGATVVLKETDFKSDEILFAATSAGGTGGLGTMDSVALQNALAGRIVSMSPYIDSNSEGLRGSSSVSDLETMLQLAHLYFVAPREDEAAFDLFKKNTITELAQLEKAPETRFSNILMPAITNKNPRKPIWNQAAAEKLDLDASMAFYKDRMKNAGDFHFYLVGNFKRDEIKDQILSYIGSIPDDGRREENSLHPWPSHTSRTVVDKRDGSQKRTSISMYFNSERPRGIPSATERYAWEVFASELQMHFLTLFREELGETYSVSMRSGFREDYSRAVASLYLQCAPDRATAVEKRAESEVALLAKKGGAEEYFAKAKETVTKSHEMDLKRNEYWLNTLDENYFNGEGADDIVGLSTTIEALTSADVAAAAAKYFDASRPVVGLHRPSK